MENQVSSQPRIRLTPEEYLALERKAEAKSEYLNGEMIPMPGVSRRHSLIATNIMVDLGTQLYDRPCEVHHDLRVKVSPTGLYTYPDIVVVSGQSTFEDAYIDTLLNPTLLFEILSKSTESYDRGEKFAHYRSVESLGEYVLVSQDNCRIEQFLRQSAGKWLYTETTDPNETIELSSIACRLSVSRVYHRIEF